MASTDGNDNRPASPGRPAKSKAADASQAKKSEAEGAEIPLGISGVLPAADLEGCLIPTVKLEFDPAPSSVRTKLSTPDALTMSWPIIGKAANIHDVSWPAQLAWVVVSASNEQNVLKTTAVNGKTVLKIDGGGRFEVLVDDKAPVIDFIAAGLIGNDKVGFALSLAIPPGATAQNSTEKLTFNLGCSSVKVETDPASDLRLGDSAKYLPPVMHDLLKKTAQEFRIVEQDAKDGRGTGDKVALIRHFESGGMSKLTWTIGFADPEGSWPKFGYAEEFEEGSFEYGWELHAKAPTTGEWVRIRASEAPLVVAKPVLEDFHVHADNPARGEWTAAGKITGFRDHEPRVRVALAMVDSAHQCYPTDLARSPQVVLKSDGSFEKALVGPKVVPGPDGTTPPAEAFAILSLVATWDGKGKQNPISGFLSYNEDTFALFNPKASTSWDHSCAWIASQEAGHVAPRGPKPKGGALHIPAPGPEAGGDPKSELKLDEIVADLVAWEGLVPHLYLDSKGYMTVGIGTCLVTKDHVREPKATLKLPLRLVDSDRFAHDSDALADDDAKRSTFNKVVVMAPKMPSDNYQTQPRLALRKEDADALVRAFLDQKASPALTRNFPDYSTFPKSARRAMVDILYNCGPGFLDSASKSNPEKNPARAPQMRAAILARNWTVAAEQVPKAGRAERRQWRMDLFNFAQTLEDLQKKEHVS